MFAADHDRMSREPSTLGDALRALPEPVAPDPWDTIAARMRPPRRRLRIALPLVAAAALAALVVWQPSAPPQPRLAAPATAAAGDGAATTAELVRESQRMESWTRELDKLGGARDGASLARAVDIEGRIALVDLQLGNAAPSSPVAHALWRRRVDLLDRLAAVRLARTGLASTATRATPAARRVLD